MKFASCEELSKEWTAPKMQRIRTSVCDDAKAASLLERMDPVVALHGQALHRQGRARNVPSLPSSKNDDAAHSAMGICRFESTSESQPLSPVSPTACAFSAQTHNLNIICMVFLMQPMTKDSLHRFLQGGFLKHKRCCSLLVTTKGGVDVWIPTELHLDDHITEHTVATECEAEWEDCVEDYVSELSVAPRLDPARPVWEIHNLRWAHEDKSRGCLVFRAHHALGDGYALMSVLMGSLRCADDPSSPLSFPGQKTTKVACEGQCSLGGGNTSKPNWWSWLCHLVISFFMMTIIAMNSFVDLVYTIFTLAGMSDSHTPIKGTRESQWEYKNVSRSSEISMEDIRIIRQGCKARRGGCLPTVNDVLLAAVSAGTHKYLEAIALGWVDHKVTTKNTGSMRRKQRLDVDDNCHDHGEKEVVFRSSRLSSGEPYQSAVRQRKEKTTSKEDADCVYAWLKRARVRAQVLVNLRGLQGRKGMDMDPPGNSISAVILGLPVQKVEDPLERVKMMKAICDRGKASWIAPMLNSIIRMIVNRMGKDLGADSLVKLGLRVTFAISNVVGPMQKAAWEGNVISSISPSTFGSTHGVIIHLISYGGNIRFVINASQNCLPQPKLFSSLVMDSLKEMKAAALMMQTTT